MPGLSELFSAYTSTDAYSVASVLLTPNFGKSDVIGIMKQSAICVNMKAGIQRLLLMKPEALLVGNSYVEAREARS